VFEFTFDVTYFHRVIDIECMCSHLVYQTLNIIFCVVMLRVDMLKQLQLRVKAFLSEENKLHIILLQDVDPV
jgi:hypothetical protein